MSVYVAYAIKMDGTTSITKTLAGNLLKQIILYIIFFSNYFVNLCLALSLSGFGQFNFIHYLQLLRQFSKVGINFACFRI